jgi:ABC-type amino acid transport substrate-binding protein
MFLSIIIISSFTAAISSSLTVSQLEPTVHGPDDLPGVRVGSVANTQPAAYLAGRGIDHKKFPTLPAAVEALAAGSLDAVVYDAPILRYVVRAEQSERVGVLAIEFERQNYGFALRPGSALREPLDRALLGIIAGTRWATLVRETLGAD